MSPAQKSALARARAASPANVEERRDGRLGQRARAVSRRGPRRPAPTRRRDAGRAARRDRARAGRTALRPRPSPAARRRDGRRAKGRGRPARKVPGVGAGPLEEVAARRARATATGIPAPSSSDRLRSTTCARARRRARRGSDARTADAPSRRAAAEKPTTGAPAARAASADFQRPWTSIVTSGSNARRTRRADRRSTAQVERASGRRRQRFVSAVKISAQCGLPSSTPAKAGSTSQPTVGAARRGVLGQRKRVDHVSQRRETDDQDPHILTRAASGRPRRRPRARRGSRRPFPSS